MVMSRSKMRNQLKGSKKQVDLKKRKKSKSSKKVKKK